MNNIEQELAPVVKELTSVEQQVNAIQIVDEKTNNEAIEFVGNLTEKKKQIEKMRKFFVDPLNAQVKSINEMFKPQIEHADNVIRIVKDKMSAYFVEQEKKALAEEVKLQKIRDNANAKREANGKEKITDPIRAVAEVQQTKNTETTQATVKTVWKHKIKSINELPDNIKEAIFAEAYKKGLIDTVIRKFINAGMREIPGVEIYQDKEVSIRR